MHWHDVKELVSVMPDNALPFHDSRRSAHVRRRRRRRRTIRSVVIRRRQGGAIGGNGRQGLELAAGDVLEEHRVSSWRPQRPRLVAIGRDEGEDGGMRAVYGVFDDGGEVVDADATVGEDLALQSGGGGRIGRGGGGGAVQFVVVVFFFDEGLLVFVFVIFFFVRSLPFGAVGAQIALRKLPLLPPVCASVCVKGQKQQQQKKKT